MWFHLGVERMGADALVGVQLTKEGVPFWSGPKRAPEPLTFDYNDVRFFLSSRASW